MIKRIVGISLILLIAFGIKHEYYLLTGGFRANKVLSTHSYNKEWECLMKRESLKVLDQEFFYLGKGRQAYVFESQDRHFVLKFVRAHRYRAPFWVDLFYLQDVFKDFVKAKKKRFSIAMNSYKLAYEKMQDKTQILFVHLNKSDDLKKRVILKDKTGRAIRIDLDKCSFLLQKKVTPIKERFSLLKKKGEIDEAKELCKSFLEEIFDRAKRGILNRDFPNIMINYGYFDSKVVEMDVGSFCEAPDLKERREGFHNEIGRWSEPFKEYLRAEFPELISYYDEALQKLLQESER